MNPAVEYIVTERDLQVLLAVGRGRMGTAAAQTALAARGWTRRDATDFLTLAVKAAAEVDVIDLDGSIVTRFVAPAG